MLVDPPRPLTPVEASVLALMLSVDVPGLADLREQARGALVTGACGCGCPTIDLAVPDSAPIAGELRDGPLPVDGVVAPLEDDTGCEVIVIVEHGRLASLELMYHDAPPATWPPLDRITLR